jgi:hypothetical protein
MFDSLLIGSTSEAELLRLGMNDIDRDHSPRPVSCGENRMTGVAMQV